MAKHRLVLLLAVSVLCTTCSGFLSAPLSFTLGLKSQPSASRCFGAKVRNLPRPVRMELLDTKGAWGQVLSSTDESSLYNLLSSQKVLNLSGDEVTIKDVVDGKKSLVVFMRHVG